MSEALGMPSGELSAIEGGLSTIPSRRYSVATEPYIIYSVGWATLQPMWPEPPTRSYRAIAVPHQLFSENNSFTVGSLLVR